MANGGTNYDYFFEDATVADLDGDGQYEIIGRWSPTNLQDNSNNGYTGPMYIDAYKLDGTLLWRVSLGLNIRAGQHYAPMMVYDFAGTGRPVMIMRTGDGTIDGVGNVIGDPNRNWVNAQGHISNGTPEYLTVFCGMTGKVLNGYIDEADGFFKTDMYVPQRGVSQDWGDNAMNRSERFMGAVAYLDDGFGNAKPSAIFSRGYYTRSTIAAWDWDGEKLSLKWHFDSNTWGRQYEGQGNHSISIADVTGNGFDDIIYGAMTIAHDGTPLYNSLLGHGDAKHVGHFIPSRPGLQIFSTFESPNPWGYALRDAQTGEVLWATPISGDSDQGLAAHIDPRFEGYQFWTGVVERVPSTLENFGIYNIQGVKYTNATPLSCNFAVWWDGTLMRNLLDRDRTNDNFVNIDRNAGVRLDRWDWENEKMDNILLINDVRMNDSHKGVPVVTASIVGDWREDFIVRTVDSNEIRLYTTNFPTEHRFYTLMHDTQYRVAIAWQNTTYNMPPHPSFYIGTGMETPPVPNIYLVGDYVEPPFPYTPEPAELGLLAFNNGTDTQVPSLAGTIRIWTRLDDVNAPVPLTWDGTAQRGSPDVIAVNQAGVDVSSYVRINWVGNRPADGMVNYIDVTKPASAAWQWMDFTITSDDQTVTIRLFNNRFVAPPALGLNAFNNGTDAQVPGMAGTIRIWTQLNRVNAAIPMRWDGINVPFRSSPDLTAVNQDGENMMQFVRINFVGNRPQDGMVNYIDVTKPATSAWQTIKLTITSEGQTIELLLTNNRYIAP